MNYKVTIIIPVFNGEKFLSKTIESCLAQNYSNYEIILIDDFSSDASRLIIQSYAEKYSSITALYNSSNLGIMATLKRVEGRLSGDALLFLGQDDLLDKMHLSTMMEEFTQTTSFIHCNCDLIDENGEFIGLFKNDTELENFSKTALSNLCSFNFVSSCGLIINKQMYDSVGGFSIKFRNFGEWELWIRLSACGSVKYCSQIRAKYRRHRTNITNSIFEKGIKQRLEFNDYILDCKKIALSALPKKSVRLKLSKFGLEILKLRVKSILFRLLLWVKFW